MEGVPPGDISSESEENCARGAHFSRGKGGADLGEGGVLSKINNQSINSFNLEG